MWHAGRFNIEEFAIQTTEKSMIESLALDFRRPLFFGAAAANKLAARRWATGSASRLVEGMLSGRTTLSRCITCHDSVGLVDCSSYLKPSLTGGDEPIRSGRPFERLRLFLVVQFNELQTRLINPPDGIADSAPEPASI